MDRESSWIQSGMKKRRKSCKLLYNSEKLWEPTYVKVFDATTPPLTAALLLNKNFFFCRQNVRSWDSRRNT